jgi:hypothetical protein
MMFKKGSFEIGATVYPVAIKVQYLQGHTLSFSQLQRPGCSKKVEAGTGGPVSGWHLSPEQSHWVGPVLLEEENVSAHPSRVLGEC